MHCLKVFTLFEHRQQPQSNSSKTYFLNEVLLSLQPNTYFLATSIVYLPTCATIENFHINIQFAF